MLESIPWQLLALSSAILNSISASVSKLQVSRGSSFQALIYKYVASIVWIGLLWTLSGAVWPQYWWLMYVYGIVGGVSVAAYTAAMRHSLSQTVLTTPINRILVILWSGMLLGEFLLFDPRTQNGRLLLLGLLLIPVIFWMFRQQVPTSRRWDKLVWLYILVGSIYPATTKLFLRGATPLTVLMFFYLGGLTAAIFFTLYRSHKLYIGKQFAITGFVHGLLASSGVLLWFMTLSLTTVTEATLLRMPIIITLTTITGLVVFGEKKSLTGRKLWGIGFAVLLMAIVLSINR